MIEMFQNNFKMIITTTIYIPDIYLLKERNTIKMFWTNQLSDFNLLGRTLH